MRVTVDSMLLLLLGVSITIMLTSHEIVRYGAG